MTRKRLGILIAGLGLAAALTLAVLPLSYAATQTGQSVSCGLAILPKNPTPPPGSNDECDAAHVRQWSWVGGVALAAALVSGVAFLRTRNGRESVAA